ncbi:MAG TPA: protocatechuate 3,4-dioxygenase subunit alpha [Candidatus Acidoferrum sp.]|nr:protocatechuate 3,4-dioxygenase subunit alpha [Candidatus Acidoferrum sp.]
MPTPATTSQTVGPFFSIGLDRLRANNLAGPGVSGERFTIEGKVFDGDGQPVPDAMIEIWQANVYGKYAHPEDTHEKPLEPGFSGHGRVPTDGNGQFRFTTIKPGSVPGPAGKPQAPHLVVSIFMRGLMKRLVTRIYFPDEAANNSDLVLSLVEPARRPTLIAKKVLERDAVLQWNVFLQGSEETVFFDC